MDRLSDWRAAAWVAFCLAALAAAAALIVPAALHHRPHRATKTRIEATLVPQTHLFGQPVTATIQLPAGYRLTAKFAPYRVLRRTITRTGHTVRYQFALDCLRSPCVGPPGLERELILPPMQIVSPTGRKLIGFWPPLRQASRLGRTDLASPQLRGDLTPPRHDGDGSGHVLMGLLLAIACGLTLAGAGVLGLRWLAWRPTLLWSSNGTTPPSALRYALLVTGLAAGGGAQDRRAALESLAVALEERGLGNLAKEARILAWSPNPPGGEAVRRLAAEVQQAARGEV
jgi:hypothetical protein